MAENPNIHFDDFIANVQPDPAVFEATIMLSDTSAMAPTARSVSILIRP